MAKVKTVKKPLKKKAAAKPRDAVQEALEVTWTLKGHLKNAQIAYLRVGELLARVRDKKLYERLKHPDLESYAEERLNLGRASLYRYLQVYDWIRDFHKEWLEPKPKGLIPDLSDAADLIWIERELARKDLRPETRSQLEALRTKALAGRLRQGDLDELRRQGQGQGKTDALKSFLSKLRFLRMRGSQVESIPEEAISKLDAAIDIIRNALELQPKSGSA